MRQLREAPPLLVPPLDVGKKIIMEFPELSFEAKYQNNIEQFRRIEAAALPADGNFNSSEETFFLFFEMEKCYGVEAYVSTILIAATIIEIYHKKVLKTKGNGESMYKKIGVWDDVKWLKKLRNDISHGNPDFKLNSEYLTNDEVKADWRHLAKRAISLATRLIHRLDQRLANGEMKHGMMGIKTI